MGPAELLRWQWANYPGNHTIRANLLLHIFTVPLFWAGTLLLLAGLVSLAWRPALAGAVCWLLPLIAQGRGHKLEPQAPVPFRGPWDFIARLLLEQWITFPRYVLSGGWWRAFRSAQQGRPAHLTSGGTGEGNPGTDRPDAPEKMHE